MLNALFFFPLFLFTDSSTDWAMGWVGHRHRRRHRGGPVCPHESLMNHFSTTALRLPVPSLDDVRSFALFPGQTFSRTVLRDIGQLMQMLPACVRAPRGDPLVLPSTKQLGRGNERTRWGTQVPLLPLPPRPS